MRFLDTEDPDARYEFALKNYQETVTYLRHGIRMGETDRDSMPMGAPSGEADPEAKAIMASCYSNMAACALKLSRFEEVVKHASTALDAGAKGELNELSELVFSCHFLCGCKILGPSLTLSPPPC